MGPLSRSSSTGFRTAVILALAAASPPDGMRPSWARQPQAPPQDTPAAADERLVLPSLPAQATPEELLEFVSGLMKPKARPKSREEMLDYLKGVCRLSVEAGDRILGQVKADDPLYTEAAKLKLQCLMQLEQLGDDAAEAELAAFAAELAASPIPELAAESRRLGLVGEARAMFSSGDFSGAPAIVKRVADMLRADPDDAQTAMLAMQFASALEQVPDGQAVAVEALGTFRPLFEDSSNAEIRQLGEGLAGKLRLLELPGKPMEIKGVLLDGQPFDPASLTGKVVLVDFWATWCGPCIAEIPNILAQYDKYHDQGFEVVGISLDQDREALESFVADKGIPWPILHEKDGGGGHPMATFYGISGIPQLILIGRDGNVVTLNARGKQLEQRLAELFKDAG